MSPVELPVISNDVNVRVVDGSIGDRVWHDLNNNGIQDAGEPGLPGLSVELRSSTGLLLSTATTDLNGQYIFLHLPSGTYNVVIPNPPVVAIQTYDLDNGISPTIGAINFPG
jgi:hypothetical protein